MEANYVSANIKLIRERIVKTAELCHRNQGEICIVAVTKTVPMQLIMEALDAGINNIGENRIHEAQLKFDSLKQTSCKCRCHLVGHLQSNKAKLAAGLFDMIQSLDSLEIAAHINRHAHNINKRQDCLIEVKVSPESTKYGVPPDNLFELYEQIKALPNIKVRGLMAMAPMTDNPEQRRPYFRKANDLYMQIKDKYGPESGMEILSMGMSDDFETAIEEGSNMVRIGRGIFK